MCEPLHLAFIGYGEVGKLFARQFLAAGVASVSAYDILFDDANVGAAKRSEAEAAGVRAAATAADAAKGRTRSFPPSPPTRRLWSRVWPAPTPAPVNISSTSIPPRPKPSARRRPSLARPVRITSKRR